MGYMRLDSAPDISINVRRSARAGRLSLRVSNLDGRVTLTVPAGMSLRTARDFAEKKAGWITSVVERQPCSMLVEVGVEIPVEGEMRMVVVGAEATARLADGAIEAPAGFAAPAVMALLKELARERLAAAAQRYSSAVGRDYVAAHEVAHLRHMDHSHAFWNVVRNVCPDYQAPRNWLRREGAALHRYRFSSGD